MKTQPYIIISGGLVTNNPTLPVFDFDEIADPDTPINEATSQIRQLKTLAEKHGDKQTLQACQAFLDSIK